MAKLAYHVHIEDRHGETHVFGPEDPLPAWAAKKITNPSAWEGGEAPTGTTEPVAPPNPDPIPDPDAGGKSGSSGDSDPLPYAKWKKPDLVAEVERRNADREADDQIEVEGRGNVADLAAALDGDDAAQAALADADDPANAGA